MDFYEEEKYVQLEVYAINLQIKTQKKSYPILRYWRGDARDHFYTLNFTELGSGKPGCQKEGNMGFIFKEQAEGTVPIYRYSAYILKTHYQDNKTNKILICFFFCQCPKGYKKEGILGYCFPKQVEGTIPLYRYYHSGSVDHFYTIYWSELGKGKGGYKYEGIAGYVLEKEN